MHFLRPLHIAVLLVIFSLLPACSKEPAPRPVPTPQLAPEDVVRTVMNALKNNDRPGPDSGIATAFEFASPQNKRQTGPLQRFIPMVKSPAYRPMLSFIDIEYGPVARHGDHAEQVVRIKIEHNQTATYIFMLRKQTDGDYKDCWMTDGVVRVSEEKPTTRPTPAAPDESETPVHPSEPV